MSHSLPIREPAGGWYASLHKLWWNPWVRFAALLNFTIWQLNH